MISLGCDELVISERGDGQCVECIDQCEGDDDQ